MIKVAVCGANGKMGQEVVKAVNADNETELVAKNVEEFLKLIVNNIIELWLLYTFSQKEDKMFLNTACYYSFDFLRLKVKT